MEYPQPRPASGLLSFDNNHLPLRVQRAIASIFFRDREFRGRTRDSSDKTKRPIFKAKEVTFEDDGRIALTTSTGKRFIFGGIENLSPSLGRFRPSPNIPVLCRFSPDRYFLGAVLKRGKETGFKVVPFNHCTYAYAIVLPSAHTALELLPLDDRMLDQLTKLPFQPDHLTMRTPEGPPCQAPVQTYGIEEVISAFSQ